MAATRTSLQLTDADFSDPRGLVARVSQGLRELGWRLATAESCTGGLLGHRLTAVGGTLRLISAGPFDGMLVERPLAAGE